MALNSDDSSSSSFRFSNRKEFFLDDFATVPVFSQAPLSARNAGHDLTKDNTRMVERRELRCPVQTKLKTLGKDADVSTDFWEGHTGARTTQDCDTPVGVPEI
jgi:hypothetical protein